MRALNPSAEASPHPSSLREANSSQEMLDEDTLDNKTRLTPPPPDWARAIQSRDSVVPEPENEEMDETEDDPYQDADEYQRRMQRSRIALAAIVVLAFFMVLASLIVAMLLRIQGSL